jgi:hypothetical protein
VEEYEVELEPEVRNFVLGLSASDYSAVLRKIERLRFEGHLLDEPASRQLRGKLRELRLSIRGSDIRITYYLASGRRAILLTVFRKSRRRERAEVERAERAMQRCIIEGHTAEDDE